MTYQFDKSGKLREPTEAELVAADADPAAAVIVLDDGVLEDGSPYWLYIAVKPSKYKEFLGLLRSQARMRLADYGTILRYGFEKEVPASVKEEMKRQYGCDDAFMAKVAADVKAEQQLFLRQQEDRRLADIVSMLKKK